MSYSKPKTESPVTCEIEWAGAFDKGYLNRYDKTKKEQVVIDNGFSFIELDSRHAVRGYNKATKSSILSNEVENIGSEDMRVFKFVNGQAKTICEGIYKDIKGEFQSEGGKYAKIVYALVTKSKDELATAGSIIKITVKGSFLGPYIDGVKGGFEVEMTGHEEKRNGGTAFRAPTLKLNPIDANQDKLAMDSDEKLQEYFLQYKRSKNTTTDVGEELGAEVVVSGDIEEDAPF